MRSQTAAVAALRHGARPYGEADDALARAVTTERDAEPPVAEPRDPSARGDTIGNARDDALVAVEEARIAVHLDGQRPAAALITRVGDLGPGPAVGVDADDGMRVAQPAVDPEEPRVLPDVAGDRLPGERRAVVDEGVTGRGRAAARQVEQTVAEVEREALLEDDVRLGDPNLARGRQLRLDVVGVLLRALA